MIANLSLSAQLAWRFARAKGVEGFVSVVNWFSMLGVMIGVATLVVVMAVMDGFQAQIVDKILGINGHLTAYVAEDLKQDQAALKARFEQIPGLESAIPLFDKEGLAVNKRKAAGVLLRGMPTSSRADKAYMRQALSSDKLSDGQGAVIGHRLAQRLGLSVGDKITLMIGRTDPEGRQLQPFRRSIVIDGLLNVGFYRFDASMVFLPLSFLQDFAEQPGALSSYEINAETVQAIGPLKSALTKEFGAKIGLQDWQTANANFIRIVETQKRLLFMVLFIIVLVAAFNIISGQVMLVNEKVTNIAILRTIGMSQATIMQAFVLLGGSLGIIGTGLGLALGLVIANNLETMRVFLNDTFGIRLFPPEIYFLAELPAQISTPVLIVIALASVSLCFLAALYPAWRAAATQPAEVLRDG